MCTEGNIDTRGEARTSYFGKKNVSLPPPIKAPEQTFACVLNSCFKHNNTSIRRHMTKRRGLPIHHRRPSVVSFCRTSRWLMDQKFVGMSHTHNSKAVNFRKIIGRNDTNSESKMCGT